VIIAQFGESANTLVKQWKGGYRYGFPTFRAAEPPVRPMRYDQSQIYSGVIGHQYKDSTNRYMYAYDPNMYLQPGFGAADGSGMTTQTKVAIGIGATVLVLGAVALARHQLRQEHGDPYAMPRTYRKFEPAWHRESGRAYRAGRRLRMRHGRGA
jgi:hypothetical protein